MNATRTLEGSCPCDAVCIGIQLPIAECYHCHCSQCRDLHAAPFVCWVKADHDQLQLVRGQANLRVHELTREQRLFCNTCGTIVFGQLIDPDARRWVWIPRAMLPDETPLTPAFHKYYASRAPWYEPHDDLPRFAGNGSLTT